MEAKQKHPACHNNKRIVRIEGPHSPGLVLDFGFVFDDFWGLFLGEC